MKKILLGITIVALVMFVSSAMAQTAKVPKALCISFGSGYTGQLAIKAFSNVPSADGNVKMYTIHGYVNLGHPVHGSGYVTPGTTVFHATFNGQDVMSNPRLRSYELRYDLSTLGGTISYTFFYPDGTGVSTFTSESVTTGDCSSLSIINALAASTGDLVEEK